MIDNEKFKELMKHYHPTFIQWHQHLTKYMRIDRESFLAEFQFILFKTMKHFDVNKATATDARFERYFMSSIRKMCNSLLRKHSSKKNNSRKNNVSLCLKRHDKEDQHIDYRYHEFIVDDIMKRYLDRTDRLVLRMLILGYSRGEICSSLNIDTLEYRRCMRRIRGNTDLVSAVSSV